LYLQVNGDIKTAAILILIAGIFDAIDGIDGTA
jgi:phosphatidylserine synthase